MDCGRERFMNLTRRHALMALALLPAACSRATPYEPAAKESEPSPSKAGWGPKDLFPPERYASELKTGAAPLLFHVGPSFLFEKGHVPGARPVGEAGEPSGISALERAVASLPREKTVVVYCGCCPYKNCPNVGPAMAALKKFGFADPRILDLPTTFRADWIDRGFPVEHG